MTSRYTPLADYIRDRRDQIECDWIDAKIEQMQYERSFVPTFIFIVGSAFGSLVATIVARIML
jgi:hypothetical protein